jgi:hypothetical protein
MMLNNSDATFVVGTQTADKVIAFFGDFLVDLSILVMVSFILSEFYDTISDKLCAIYLEEETDEEEENGGS